MRLRNSSVALLGSLALVGLLGAACGEGSGGAPGAGGSVAPGGGQSAGGSASTGGGAVATGGTRATGGITGAGGGVATGGSATGGQTTGGANSTGGANTGGQASGGESSGGAAATGGQGTGGGSIVDGCLPAPTTYPNLFVTVSGHTQEESDAKVASAWSTLFNASSSGTIYFNGPGADESYVKDIWNNDVRSEGMSYGMMAAVQLDHQTEFDRLWTWVRNHMAQGCSGNVCTGEVAWSCSTSGNKNSNGGAPDGEEYMATALIFAQNRWGDSGKFDYANEARWVLDVVRTKYFHLNPHLVKFVANSNNTDPSYILPAFYQVWACFDPDNSDFWNEAITDGRQYFHVGVNGQGICPYQSSWDGSNPQAANSDSLRCVMNLMMDHNFFAGDPWQTETYAPMYAASQANAGPPGSYCNATLGFGLPAAQGKAFVDKIWSANVPSSDYWGGVLYMLSLLHVSGDFKLYY